ncbi:MAG: germination protein YpeB [Oscillospiraceae bacterium]|jgi:germination protein YpeB|nr:germination protein YpeB [Oscillospiraceae bacterium]
MKRKKIRIISFFAALTVLFAAALLMLQAGRRTAADTVRAEKLGALLRLTEYTQNLSPELEKAAVLSSPALFSEHLGAIIENAACARLSLDALTDGEDAYAGLYRAYRQLGDFALYLQHELSAGRELPEPRRDTLRTLAAFTASLTKQLTLLSGAVLSGEKSADGAESALRKAKVPLLAEDLPEINKALEGLPKLIYDGPFSDNEDVPKDDTQEAWQISKEKAADIAAEFLNIKPLLLRELDEQDVPYPAYRWCFGGKSVKIAKNGGVLAELSQTVRAGAARLTDGETRAAAAEYLTKQGFSNMQAVSARDTDGVRTFEFARSADGVLYYTDIIKISVALDSGDIVGLDAGLYVMKHRARKLASAVITAQAALDLLPAGLEAAGQPQLALIPKRGAEVLCWELSCRGGGGEYRLYLNAADGGQEDVLIVTRSGGTVIFN